MNDISATIFYNQRFIISAPIPEPLAWRLTKQEDISPKGVRKLTFAQDKFDQHNDYIEKDEDGNIIGMYADYYKNYDKVHDYNNLVVDNNQFDEFDDFDDFDTPNVQHITSVIKCSGKKQIKVGGSYKTIAVTFYNNDEEIEPLENLFSFSIEGNNADELFDVTYISTNSIKIKFLGSDEYLGKVVTVTNISNNVTSTLDIEIIPL